MFNINQLISIFRKHISKKDAVFLAGIALIYFISRLCNLEKFPIFSDEGIYIHWAKVAWHDATWRFISLTDGKQPLQTWATIPFLKIFPNDALLAGRLFAVFSGFFALTGIVTTAWYLFGKRAGFIAGILYIVTPYFLFYDRLALVDSAVNGFFIWILFLSILLARLRRLDVALLFGLVGGLGSLAKSSVRIFLGLAVFGPILFYEKNHKKFLNNIVNFLVLYAIGGLLAFAVYNVQRLSPFLHFVAEKNKTFVVTFDEFVHTPFAYFFSNVQSIPLYVSWESGFVLTILGIVGLFFLQKKHQQLFWYFLVWILVPFFIVAFFSKILFPRYIIFFASLLVICAAFYLNQLKNKTHLILIALLIGLSVIYFHYTILFDQKDIPLPAIDRGQYIEAWPAGWGAQEIVDYARANSTDKPVVFIAEGNFGMTGDVLDTFIRPGDRISIKGYWPLDTKNLLENQNLLDSNHVYVVYAHKDTFENELPLRLIKKFTKPGNQSALYLFELTR